jgi:hypothetical protein
MEDVGIFYGHFFYFTALRHTYFVAIGYILWSFGLFYVFCISPPRFGMLYQENLATLI